MLELPAASWATSEIGTSYGPLPANTNGPKENVPLPPTICAVPAGISPTAGHDAVIDVTPTLSLAEAEIVDLFGDAAFW